jgi:hypothetical protein
MKKEIPKSRGGSRPGAGRPATGKDPVRAIRLSDEFLKTVDGWAAKEADEPARSEAIRRLVELGLTVKTRPKQSAPARAERAKELAAKVIDKMTPDVDTDTEEQARRKRRLLKGPEEFRDVRVDRKKK